MVTHADQDCDGLSFVIESTHDDGRVVVSIDGPEDKINAWKTRVNGTEITKYAKDSLVEIQKKNTLEKEIAEIETDLADKKVKLSILKEKI